MTSYEGAAISKLDDNTTHLFSISTPALLHGEQLHLHGLQASHGGLTLTQYTLGEKLRVATTGENGRQLVHGNMGQLSLLQTAPHLSLQLHLSVFTMCMCVCV